MSWGTELWDQYDTICQFTDQGIEHVKRVSNFVKDRIHIENNYAKELRKLVKSYKKKEDENSHYTTISSFAKMVQETNDLANQRELISENLQGSVLEPLKQLMKDKTIERKKLVTDGNELLRQLKNQMDNLEKTKRTYEKASEDAEVAQINHDKGDKDQNMTKAKMDKLVTILRTKTAHAEDCRNNYLLFLEETNKKQDLHYTSQMPEVMTRFQHMDTGRITRLRELMRSYADVQRNVMPIIGKCLDSITAAADHIDPVKDCEQLVKNHKTGFSTPEHIQFVEYGSKQASKGRTARNRKVEPKEDYSHLPPEQQRRKLQAKVDELDAAIQKTLSDKTAMEKMQTVYSQNPALGDPKQVQQSLEVTHGKLDDLNAELYKFKTWLHEVEGKSPPDPPSRYLSAPGMSPARTISATSVGNSKNSPTPVRKAPDKPALQKGSSLTRQQSPQQPPPAQQPPPQQPQVQQSQDDEWFSDDDEPISPAAPTGSQANVLYDFEAQNPDELSVKANEVVVVIEDPGDGWLKVKRGADSGYVPSSYVQLT